jgi:hypothetical protein
MKNRSHFSIPTILLILMLLTVSLAGCSNHSTPTPAVTAIPPTPELVATPTSTAIPARIVLFDPNGKADEAFTAMLSDFAAANSLGFETSATLADNLEGVKVMIVYGALENLTQVAAAAPQTQFVSISQSVTPTGNISVVSANPVHLAFMAGFLAALTSDDWRAGALISDDANLGLVNAFENGGEYLCGRCTPSYAPVLFYPQVYALAGSSDAAAWSAQASALLTDTAANSVYLSSGGDIPEVLDQFSEALIYGSDPASPNLARYTAILGADATSALQQALPDLLAGNGGKTINAKVGLVLIKNPEIITQAKVTLFNQVAQDLANDQIVPLSVP